MVIYASIADLISAEHFFKILFSILASLVMGFWTLISLDTDPLVFPAYFLFYEVISEILLVHCALYLNQNINTLQAKRLSPIIFNDLRDFDRHDKYYDGMVWATADCPVFNYATAQTERSIPLFPPGA